MTLKILTKVSQIAIPLFLNLNVLSVHWIIIFSSSSAPLFKLTPMQLQHIQQKIHEIRGMKVMLDFDLQSFMK